jgi:hypothetical protein
MLHKDSSRARRRAIMILLATFLLLALIVLVVKAEGAEPAAGETFAASTSAAGEFADAGSGQALSISDDGRYVAFTSSSANLVPGAPAEAAQAYVKDLLTGEALLASRADGADGEPADEPREEAKVGVERPLISGDGRYLVFDTPADNLLAGFAGDGFSRHVYRRDLSSGETVLVDRIDGAEGASSPAESRVSAISPDGRYVVFSSEVEDLDDPAGDHEPGVETVYVRDLVAGTTIAAAHAEEGSFEGAISRDGRYLLFTSWSAELDPDANGLSQVYRRDLETGETVLVSRSSPTPSAPAGEPSDGEIFEPAFVGGGGCRVAFTGFAATNLVAGTEPALGVYLRDLCASPPTTELISLDEGGAPFDEASFAGSTLDGSRVLLMGTPPSPRHLYLRDLTTGQTRLLDRASGAAGTAGDGEVAWGALAANGCRAAFSSAATNLTPQLPPSGPSNLLQVYVRQLDPCQATAPSSVVGEDGAGSGERSESPKPRARMKVGRLTRTHLRLWFSAAAAAELRIRRRNAAGRWPLVRTLPVEAATRGPLTVALPQLSRGRYRLAIRLHQPGSRARVRFLNTLQGPKRSSEASLD